MNKEIMVKIGLSALLLLMLAIAAAWGWGVGVGMERRKQLSDLGEEHFGEKKQWGFFTFIVILAVLFCTVLFVMA